MTGVQNSLNYATMTNLLGPIVCLLEDPPDLDLLTKTSAGTKHLSVKDSLLILRAPSSPKFLDNQRKLHLMTRSICYFAVKKNF